MGIKGVDASDAPVRADGVGPVSMSKGGDDYLVHVSGNKERERGTDGHTPMFFSAIVAAPSSCSSEPR